jgi:chemotaxis protein MotB
MSRSAARPLVIRRVSESRHHGHHGGAWKVAYADFVTAMMAFFLLLWLISSASDETRKGLADFFSDATVNVGPPGGAGGVLDGITAVPNPLPSSPVSLLDQRPALPRPEQDPLEIGLGQAGGGPDLAADPAGSAVAGQEEAAQLDRAGAAILAALEASPELRPFADSLLVDQTPEGLRIQILDREQAAMFPLGSDAMYAHTRKLLQVVVQAIAGLRQRISIQGHTDALPFAPGAGYDNWRLSADRANATRLALVEAGLDPKRVAEVVGKGDADPLVPGRADDPRNRRISIVLRRDGPEPWPPADRD